MKRSLESLRTIGLTVSALALFACNPTPRGVEAPQVMERWRPNFSGTCSSWLTSHVSGNRYCASPPVVYTVAKPKVADSKPKYDESKTDHASLMAAGEQVYTQVCAACHQANGEGVSGQFPPLAGAGEFYGPAQRHAWIVINGLSGEIVVKGTTYNAAMPAQGALSDYEIAAAITYERSSWGNADGDVLPADVKAARALTAIPALP
jgi:mono/diheme cytochrome c family protein